MKTIMVTGGNRGIGLEICRQLDGLGHRVVLSARDLDKGLEAAKSLSDRVIVKQLDVTDEESILRAFTGLESETGQLDVLINNAALGASFERGGESSLKSFKKFLEKNIPGIRQVNKMLVPALRSAGAVKKRETASDISLLNVRYIMETNFYGAWRMVQVFLPLLEKSDDARIINISSGLGELDSLDGQYPGYSLSKTALNALTLMFSRELKEKGISVNAVCPGWVKTDMGGPNAPRSISQGADTPVWLATNEHVPTGKFFRDRKIIDW